MISLQCKITLCDDDLKKIIESLSLQSLFELLKMIEKEIDAQCSADGGCYVETREGYPQ